MSRAINVNAVQADVVKLCNKHGAAISAIEALASGGTRVVFNNVDATETMTRIFGRKVLTGTVPPDAAHHPHPLSDTLVQRC